MATTISKFRLLSASVAATALLALSACGSPETDENTPVVAQTPPPAVSAEKAELKKQVEQAVKEAAQESAKQEPKQEVKAEPAPAPAEPAKVQPPAEPELPRLVTTYVVKKDEDMLDIGRNHSIGFLELMAANPGVDAWFPGEGRTIVLPTVHLLPLKMQTGILINTAQMRLFRFENGKVVETYPLGIGREGLESPTGSTTVQRKTKDPVWYPTERMRKEKPELPVMMPAGPDNPMGNRAIYLGWSLYRIHGTNIPWGVGRRVSSGCLRLYPEDIEKFYENVQIGMPVQGVNQRLMAEWRDGRLWIQVYPTYAGWDAMENHDPLPPMPLTSDMVAVITRAAPQGVTIDWKKVDQAVRELRGYPVAVTGN